MENRKKTNSPTAESKQQRDRCLTTVAELNADGLKLSDWIDGADVVRMLNISKRTLQTLRDNGTLPFALLGGKMFYTRQAVARTLKNKYVMYKLCRKEVKT